MNALFRSLVVAGVQYAVAQTLVKSERAQRRLWAVLRGAIFLILAGLLAGLAAIFLLASLFFTLADMAEFVTPALITALVASAGVIGFTWEGWRQLKK